MSSATRDPERSPDDALDFDRLVTPAPLGPGRFSIDVPDGWQQGRGAFGGLVLAMMARAAEATAADRSRLLRSLSAQLVGPVQPGAAEIATEVLRSGSAVTAMTVRLRQGDAVQAHAAVILARSRATYDAPTTLAAPQPPSWRDPATSGLQVSDQLPPTFAKHLEYWPSTPLPRSGAGPAATQQTAGWVRLRRPGAARDAAFPALLSSAHAGRPRRLRRRGARAVG